METKKTETLDNFLIVKALGEGYTGEVKLGRESKTGTLFALKILEKKAHPDFEDALSGLKNELKLLKSVSHKNIIKLENLVFKGSYRSRDGVKEVAYAVLEFAPRGEIFDLVSRVGAFSDNTTRVYFRQFVSAMLHLHEKSIAHRDIKLENILLDEKLNLKLVDFGFATYANPSEMNKTDLGTPRYMAPEQLAHKKYDAKKVDVFSSGIVLFILQTSRPPFLSADRTDKFYQMYLTNRTGFWNVHQNSMTNKMLSPEFRQLVDAMLEADPANRLTFQQVSESAWLNLPTDEELGFKEAAQFYQKTQEVISRERQHAVEESRMQIEGTRSNDSCWFSDVEIRKDDCRDNCYLIKTTNIQVILEEIKNKFADKNVVFEKENGQVRIVVNKNGLISIAKFDVWQVSDDLFAIKLTKKTGDYMEVCELKTRLQQIVETN